MKHYLLAAALVAALPMAASASTFHGSRSFGGWSDGPKKYDVSRIDFGGKADFEPRDKEWSHAIGGGKLPTQIADATFGHGSKGGWKGWGDRGGFKPGRGNPDCAPAPVPLPAGFGLLAAGIGALGIARRRRTGA